MKTMTVLTLCLGVMAMFAAVQPQAETDREQARAVAVNYAVYRNAVFSHVLTHPGAAGSVSSGVLELPDGWLPMRAWKNRMHGGNCYVYGPASGAEIAEVRSLLRGSVAVLDDHDARPAFIPSGCVVSVVEVQ
ncbi:type IV pilus biogenesis protein PilM [Pseudodesulfovibrio tunisiensis]|uniref:type IV pilus biogenesis protein PilM n=1 Tax=Pseudodesulfovibrio tunisiensis TaxID=463192 RepID=UPI001FB550F2|nr:type IV pilus biogenesis protein PilM [Pseudodesulfovibrio tunisiensis]